MDINFLIQKIINASTEEEKKLVEQEISAQFESLSEDEKKRVQTIFMKSFDEQLQEGQKLLEEIRVEIEIAKISKYISLSQIAKDYFGKSKEWLYQRIKGYNVNGKPAQFTPEERSILSKALMDISESIKETSLRLQS